MARFLNEIHASSSVCSEVATPPAHQVCKRDLVNGRVFLPISKQTTLLQVHHSRSHMTTGEFRTANNVQVGMDEYNFKNRLLSNLLFDEMFYVIYRIANDTCLKHLLLLVLKERYSII